mgnify:CR=1 FL=1
MAYELAPEQWKTFADVLPYGAVLHREERLFLNRVAEQITGYCSHEIKNFSDWLHKLYGEQWEKVHLLYQHDRARGFQHDRVIPIRTKTGDMKWVECSGSLLDSADLWILRDVSDRFQAMDTLRTRNAALQEELHQRTEELERTVNMLLSYRQKLQQVDDADQLKEGQVRIELAKDSLQGLFEDMRNAGDDLREDGLADWSKKIQNWHNLLMKSLYEG